MNWSARALTLSLFAALSGCGPAPDMAGRGAPANAQLPSFSTVNPFPAARSNAEIAQDFLELGFFMESGRPLPRLTRFEGPVTLRLTGPIPAGAAAAADQLVGRLRREARLDIARVPGDATANITVEFLPRSLLRSLVPQAACFVVPNVDSWQGFRANRRGPLMDWAQVSVRETVAVFIPSDTTPQETRDCLHEEIAQALGPLNDLYRLPDSVFNDDNFQTTLTGFDMLILRAWYAPELQNGMDAQQVATRLPGLLRRINPAGRTGRAQPPSATPRDWVEDVEATLSGTADGTRHAAARRALSVARAQGWQDGRLAFSLFLVTRFAPQTEAESALAALLQAGEIYRALPGGEVHAAHISMHLAAQALAADQNTLVLRLTEEAMPAATRSQNAALLASLMLLRAEALEATGQIAQARALRLDSQGWARYGFGTERAVRGRVDEIAALHR
jgi:hypothetical protein